MDGFPSIPGYPLAPELPQAALCVAPKVEFNDERYILAQTLDAPYVEELLAFEGFWTSPDAAITLNEDELRVMSKLPPVEFQPTTQRAQILAMISVLFATVADARLGFGDVTNASAWNVLNLSPHLRGEAPRVSSVSALLRASVRNFLHMSPFPSFDLARAAVRDVAAVLARGPCAVQKLLLRAHAAFEAAAEASSYNREWVAPMLSFAAVLTAPAAAALGAKVAAARVEKADLADLMLEALDEMAREVAARVRDE